MLLPLRGIITPLVTPFAESNRAEPSLDGAALERLLEHVIAGGVNGIFLLGTTGEFASIDRELREELIRQTSTIVNRRIPVLASITDTALSDTLRLADAATDAGADALVLAAPYYFLHSQDDLLRYLELVTERISLPLFLYNIPHLTKTSYEPSTVRRAADMPGIVGLKDSTGDLNYLDRTMAALQDRPGFTVLIGPEELLVESMKRGTHGGVCGGSNLKPALFVELYNAIVRGDEQCAAELQERIAEMGRLLYKVGAPGGSYMRGIKAALSLEGLCRPECAPPFAPFTEAEYERIEQGLRQFRNGQE
jgi:4-hydroxy-tetrahydrodipicolinate synthase